MFSNSPFRHAIRTCPLYHWTSEFYSALNAVHICRNLVFFCFPVPCCVSILTYILHHKPCSHSQLECPMSFDKTKSLPAFWQIHITCSLDAAIWERSTCGKPRASAVLYCMYVDTFKIYRVVCESGRIGFFLMYAPFFFLPLLYYPWRDSVVLFLLIDYWFDCV